MEYFLGVDVGGTKSHALIADKTGLAVGFAQAGPGSWESVGYKGLTEVLKEIAGRAINMAGIQLCEISGAGLGLAGYDWPSQKQFHLEAIAHLGLNFPPILVNDAVLGITAGSQEGWGISVVSGTGCNCRGLSKDRQREGRVVGGAGYWSGEAAGGSDILFRAMRAVTYEWTERGSATALSQAFLNHTGAKDLDELVEGAYIGRYDFDQSMIMLVFEIARQGDSQALDVMRWAGSELGGMVIGVANQLSLKKESFDVVLIGSIFDGHPLISETMRDTIQGEMPGAHLVRLNVSPVVGGVILGMEAAGINIRDNRQRLIESTDKLLSNKLG